MKKLLISLLALCGAAVMAFAVPALPGRYLYRQPDGTVLTLQNHGDEYFHWTTDAGGRVVEKGADGFYHAVDPGLHQNRVRQASRASMGRRSIWSSYNDPPVTNFGDRKVLCIIANFTDSTFVIDNPRERFTNLLNQEGYDYNGAIGSVRDYYMDNSNGLYRPVFDVYGPVNLSHSSKYYDDNGAHLAIREAYELMADEIPIDDYDTDGDGTIDMILFYYPGHNEAEGAGEESIWPHQSTGWFGYLGDKRFTRYFCTSELRGYAGTTMCPIGTTCHEFAHSLGLPDFYDTDYGTNGSNSDGSGKFDVMNSGSYNDAGRRPPYLSATERNMLGWMPDPGALPSGEVVLEPVRNNKAYFTTAVMEGEYFVLECRDNYKWDSALGDFGLLIYHVDKSSRLVPGSGSTAADIWNYTNSINAYGGHPCYWALSAVKDIYICFPGVNKISTLLFTDWDGNTTGALLNGISFDGSKVSFNSVLSENRILFGSVRDSSGSPIEDAEVILSTAEYPFAKSRVGLSSDLVATTNADGYYEFSLPKSYPTELVVVVRKDNYTPVAANMTVSSPFVPYYVILPRLSEGDHADLQRYNPSLSYYSVCFGVEQIAAAMHYGPEELAAEGWVGSRIESVAFQASPTTWEKAYVIIQVGNTLALARDVTNLFIPGSKTVVSVADAGITIPAGKDILIGYALSGLNPDEYNLNMYGLTDSPNDGNWVNSNFNNPSGWVTCSFGGVYADFIISAEISEVCESGFDALGVAWIRLEDGVPTLVPARDRTVYGVQWYLDGEAVNAPTALQPGKHSYMARVTYYDGTVERVYYDWE